MLDVSTPLPLRAMRILAFIVAAYALVLLIAPEVRPPFLRERAAMMPAAVYLHLAGGAVAMALGPFQFSAALRARRLDLHRWLGRTYLVAVLLGSCSGFVLATVSQGGLVAHLGFGTLAVLWLATAARGYQLIRRGDDVSHRRWMIRNYALTFAAVTLRIYLPLALLSGVSFAVAYPAIAWLCWVPNLIVLERWIRQGQRQTAAV